MQRRISIHALRVEGDGQWDANVEQLQRISIHALRVEGDIHTGRAKAPGHINFYPRPPGGGRQAPQQTSDQALQDFYPRPPGGGRLFPPSCKRRLKAFLSTPSGWRATLCTSRTVSSWITISIHALRVEGDRSQPEPLARPCYFYPRPPGGGRPRSQRSTLLRGNFYPRPPGGGRPMSSCEDPLGALFLSTPSGWRATTGGISGSARSMR